MASRTAADLRQHLLALQGRGYKAYKDVEGEYAYARFTLYLDHAQGDPFASPSRLRARVPQRIAAFPAELYASPGRRVALADYLTRRFAVAIKRSVKGRRGSGHSGMFAVDAGGQEILVRTSCVVDDRFVEMRFLAGLPAAGRTCLGREAAEMFLDELPQLVEASMVFRGVDAEAARRHVEVNEDQDALRAQLAPLGLVSFVADGSVLPRISGASEHPLSGPRLVPFAAPASLRVMLRAPNRGPVMGLGIPRGVTLIVGGGYHGKSTLLAAVDRGVYNHIPGDGRECVVSLADAVKIRAEDGRSVQSVDISPFISNLPFGQDTTSFSTDNASGSTSQAANIIEALEQGTHLLLIDEDTSATNFMIRDARMQRLVAKRNEPITPFIDQVRNLATEHGVSTIMVIGGSGDYFDVADNVICLVEYRATVVTEEARRVAAEIPTRRAAEGGTGFGSIAPRVALAESLDPYRGGKVRVSARGLEALEFGPETIDLSAVEELVAISQTRAIGEMMLHGLRQGYFDRRTSLHAAIVRIFADVTRGGLDALSTRTGEHPGDLALPRPHEVAAALNRLRGLRFRRAG